MLCELVQQITDREIICFYLYFVNLIKYKKGLGRNVITNE